MPSDFIDLARTIANARFSFNATSVSCRLHDEQGCFSLTYVVELEDQSYVIVQFRDTPLDLSHYVLARRTSFFASMLVPLSVSAEKLGTLIPTIEKTSTDVSVSAHVYIMDCRRRTLRSLANLERRYLAVSLAQTPQRSLNLTLSRVSKLYYAKTFHQTDLNYVEALKNSSRLLLISRNSLFLFPMWISMRRT